jgi:hypothetical protein
MAAREVSKIIAREKSSRKTDSSLPAQLVPRRNCFSPWPIRQLNSLTVEGHCGGSYVEPLSPELMSQGCDTPTKKAKDFRTSPCIKLAWLRNTEANSARTKTPFFPKIYCTRRGAVHRGSDFRHVYCLAIPGDGSVCARTNLTSCRHSPLVYDACFVRVGCVRYSSHNYLAAVLLAQESRGILQKDPRGSSRSQH